MEIFVITVRVGIGKAWAHWQVMPLHVPTLKMAFTALPEAGILPLEQALGCLKFIIDALTCFSWFLSGFLQCYLQVLTCSPLPTVPSYSLEYANRIFLR